MQASDFDRLWRQGHTESLEETRRFWNNRAEEFNDITHCADREERFALLRYLEEKGALQKGSKVLDIGCGAGRFSLEMASMGLDVTGLDISPLMIRHAQENARAAGLANCRFSAMAWEDAALAASVGQGAFDLVFASMSPAIRSEETLMRMHAASRGFCFLSGFIKRRDMLQLRFAARLSPGATVPPYEGGMYYAFNVLWQHGIYADFSCHETRWTKVWDIETAVETYKTELAFLWNKDEAGLAARLAAIGGELAVNGRLERETRAKIAWLFWRAGADPDWQGCC